MTDREDIINLLSQLIEHRENELAMDYGEGKISEKAVQHFTELIIAITKYVHDVRYCTNPDCPCSPESKIRMNYEPIKEYLKKKVAPYALTPNSLETIEKIIY